MQEPTIINDLEKRLIEALEKDNNPSISIEEAAKILGQDKDCLRVAIANGTCPFGYGGQHKMNGQRFGRVSKMALYRFLIKGA